MLVSGSLLCVPTYSTGDHLAARSSLTEVSAELARRAVASRLSSFMRLAVHGLGGVEVVGEVASRAPRL